MKLRGLAGLAGLCLATTTAFGADLFESAPPPMDAPPGAQQELGSNWYIRGDVGYGQVKQDTVSLSSGLYPTVGNQPIGDATKSVSPTRGNSQTVWSPTVSLGVGYRVNDWFRAEANWTFSKGPGWSSTTKAFCPEVANAVPTANGAVQTTPVGYQYSYNVCNGYTNVSQYNNTALAMGYVDLGHYWILNPFIGAGAGLNVNTMSGSLNYVQSDTGTTYAGATVTGAAPAIWVTQTGVNTYTPLRQANPSRGVPQSVGVANWHRSISSNKYTFAAAVAAGLGIQISQSATLDLAYKITSLDVTGGVKGLQQAFTIGVRYNIN